MLARLITLGFSLALCSCTMFRDYRNALFEDRSSEALSLSAIAETQCADGSLEKESILRADSILSPQIMSGTQYRIKPEVKSDGINYYFEVDTDAGSFSAYGLTELEDFLSEVPSAIELNKLSTTVQASKSAFTAATGPLRSAYHLITSPVESVKQIPQAADDLYEEGKRMVSSASQSVSEATSSLSSESGKGATVEKYKTQGIDLANKWADDYVGYAKAKRQIAAEYGVDPYSKNPLIQSQLRRLASAGLAGKAAAGFVPGIPYLSYASTAEKLLWRKSSKELAADLLGKYKAAGMSDLTARKLIAGESFTPGQQILLADAFVALGKAEGKEQLAKSLITIDNRSFANMLVDTYQLLARAAAAKGGFTKIALARSVPYGITTSGAVFLPNAADSLHWVNAVCDFFSGPAKEITAQRKIFYSARPISAQAARQLASRGWSIETAPSPHR